MLTLNLIHLTEFIKISLSLYYKNFKIDTKLILIHYKVLLLFKYLLFIKYFNYNKTSLLKNFLLNKKVLDSNLQVKNNILNIKIIAKTTKSTIIRKFDIISAIRNQTNWIGLGTAKHKKLSTAVRNSYKNAFKNILYFNTKFCNLKNLNLKFKKTLLIIYKNNFINLSSIKLSNIFNLIGFFINYKIIGVSSNITNLLYILKNLNKLSDYNL